MGTKNYIAVAVNKNDKIWYGNFGISPYYMLFDSLGDIVGKRINPHGVGQSRFLDYSENPPRIIDLLHDCIIFVGKKMGDKSHQLLSEKYGIKTIVTQEDDPKISVKFLLNSVGK